VIFYIISFYFIGRRKVAVEKMCHGFDISVLEGCSLCYIALYHIYVRQARLGQFRGERGDTPAFLIFLTFLAFPF
jgi:hypothetical protein